MSESGESVGASILSTRVVVPAVSVLVVLWLIVPQVWELGVKWGEMQTELRSMRQGLSEHLDDYKVMDLRLRKLEPGPRAGNTTMEPETEVKDVRALFQGSDQRRGGPVCAPGQHDSEDVAPDPRRDHRRAGRLPLPDGGAGGGGDSVREGVGR